MECRVPDRIDQPYAFSGTQNSTIDRLIDALSTTVDEDASRALWIEYQRAIMEEQPYTYFYFRDRLVGVNRRLQGVEMDVRGEWTTVRDWYIDPASP